jgi:hypothetical protein
MVTNEQHDTPVSSESVAKQKDTTKQLITYVKCINWGLAGEKATLYYPQIFRVNLGTGEKQNGRFTSE